ncbi:MAG: class I tRNA ligase family protein [Ignavibacteria bacterium]
MLKIKTAKDEELILAKDRLEVIKDEYQIVSEYKGKDLESTEYERLFDFFNLNDEKKHSYVIPGEFVTSEDGTGIVHIAPAFGEDDYQAGLKYDLPVFKVL